MTVFFHAHIDELEYMLRIAIAALCGGIIGFERSRMRKRQVCGRILLLQLALHF